ncbi:MAG: squalene/phytoene synthase family protein [Pseudomonadota bacterium]
MTFDPDLTACAALVEKVDPERFAAAMASPVVARRVLFPLYAFNVEVARAPWVTQEPMIAEMRLQWWRDALEEIASGQTVRRHEVVTPLAAILTPADAHALDRLVGARRWDIYKDAFEDHAHFDSYLEATAGELMAVAARALAPDIETAALTKVRAIGRATGLARFLQAVPALEAQQRVPMVDGRAAALKALAEEALVHCAGPGRLRRELPPAARPAMTEAYLARDILRQVVQSPGRVGDGTLGVSAFRRTFLLWRWSR